MWFYLQIAIVLALYATSLVLMFTGKEAMGFALGALALSLCTCSYAAMMHERVVMMRDATNEIAADIRHSNVQMVAAVLNEFEKQVIELQKRNNLQ